MRMKLVLAAFAMAAVLVLSAPRAEAQVIGGYVGFGSPGAYTFGAPLVAPSPLVTPVMPYYATGYTTVVPRPWVGVSPYYGNGWGYSRGYGGVYRGYPVYRYRRGYRRWW